MNVLVTGGGTTAPIDDVRTITNISSGRFAAAITESCLGHGARVWHVHAASAQLPLARLARFDLDTADPDAELDRLRRLRGDWVAKRDRLQLVPLRTGNVAEYAETIEHLLRSHPFHLAFLAMAVSDYEPVPRAGKLCSSQEELIVRCRQTPKVIRSVRDWAPSIYLVGFKLLSGATTIELIRQAEASGRINRADLTVANDLQSLIAGQHTVHLVRPGHQAETLGPGPDLADRLVARVFHWALGSRQ
jgi:phosphopantothenoylcysteine synthetase/decarboxylase